MKHKGKSIAGFVGHATFQILLTCTMLDNLADITMLTK